MIKEGRFAFFNGGWVASDEANPTYEQLIGNMLVGHNFLKETFGIQPKHAWHADSFRHSSVIPELFAQMGFESISYARIS